MSLSKGKNWEGLGGPVHNYYDSSTSPKNDHDDDPTLDSCCQRDKEEQRIGVALRTTLRKYDIVAERERRRRHTVSFNHSNSSALYMGGVHGISTNVKNDSGCRCSYDPNGDGGEYRTLLELRRERTRLNNATEDEEEYENRKKYPLGDSDDDHDVDTNNMKVESSLTTKTISASTENESEEELDEYDYLLDDDLPSGSGGISSTNKTLKALEEQRRMELEWEIFQNEVAMLHGYGIHRQIHPQRILSIAGLFHSNQRTTIVEPPPYVVMHLVDADNIGSASLDLYLEVLATKFRGTMFVRSSGRATLLLNDANIIDSVLPMFRNYTVSKNVDSSLPALVAIRNGTAINACLQLQGLLSTSYSRDYDTNNNEVEPFAVRDWLDHCGVLQERSPDVDTMCRIRPEEEALLDSCTRRQRQPEVIEEGQRYDCGKNDCSKSFPHEHIGERNEQQNGLLISETEILN